MGKMSDSAVNAVSTMISMFYMMSEGGEDKEMKDCRRLSSYERADKRRLGDISDFIGMNCDYTSETGIDM